MAVRPRAEPVGDEGIASARAEPVWQCVPGRSPQGRGDSGCAGGARMAVRPRAEPAGTRG
jgi:hypothetical protein